jgi:hypothetical protein
MVPLQTDWIYQLFIKETTKKVEKSPEQFKKPGETTLTKK